MGYDGVCAFLCALDTHRETVAQEFDILLGQPAGECRGKGCQGKEGSGETDLTALLPDLPEAFAQRVSDWSKHPRVLALRDDDEHLLAMAAHGIEPIDLLIVNLYPFEETVAKGADHATCIENIDIGGPAMIRAASKNHKFVTVLTDPADYQGLLDQLAAQFAGCAVVIAFCRLFCHGHPQCS